MKWQQAKNYISNYEGEQTWRHGTAKHAAQIPPVICWSDKDYEA